MESEYKIENSRDYIIARLSRLGQMAIQAEQLRQARARINYDLRQLQNTANSIMTQMKEEGYDIGREYEGQGYLDRIES